METVPDLVPLDVAAVEGHQVQVAGDADEAVMLAHIVIDVGGLQVLACLHDKVVGIAELGDVQVAGIDADADVVIVHRLAHLQQVAGVIVPQPGQIFQADDHVGVLDVVRQLQQCLDTHIKPLLHRIPVGTVVGIVKDGILNAQFLEGIQIPLQIVDGVGIVPGGDVALVHEDQVALGEGKAFLIAKLLECSGIFFLAHEWLVVNFVDFGMIIACFLESLYHFVGIQHAEKAGRNTGFHVQNSFFCKIKSS